MDGRAILGRFSVAIEEVEFVGLCWWGLWWHCRVVTFFRFRFMTCLFFSTKFKVLKLKHEYELSPYQYTNEKWELIVSCNSYSNTNNVLTQSSI